MVDLPNVNSLLNSFSRQIRYPYEVRTNLYTGTLFSYSIPQANSTRFVIHQCLYIYRYNTQLISITVGRYAILLFFFQFSARVQVKYNVSYPDKTSEPEPPKLQKMLRRERYDCCAVYRLV